MAGSGEATSESQATFFRDNLASIIVGLAITSVIGVFSFMYYLGLDFRVHQRDSISAHERLDRRIEDTMTATYETISSYHEPVKGLSQRDRIVLNTQRLDELLDNEALLHKTIGQKFESINVDLRNIRSALQDVRSDERNMQGAINRITDEHDKMSLQIEWCKRQLWKNGSTET